MVRVHLALDESNHTGDPEVIAAIFSLYPEDAKVRKYRNKKRLNDKELENFLGDNGRIWKTLTIPRKEIIPRMHPLIQAAPTLVDRFIGYHFGIDIDLDIQLDGYVKDVESLENALDENPFINRYTVRQFPKVKRDDGRFRYSEPLRVADTLASKTYRDRYKKSTVTHPVMREASLFYPSTKKAVVVGAA